MASDITSPEFDGTPTPPTVTQHATEQARLDRVALIGIFGNPNAPHALVRLPRGNTQKVSVGDTVARGTVAAIGTDRLVLSRTGTNETLRLPQG